MSWKSIFLTIVVSAFLFTGLVSMGMKYHWIDVFKNKTEKQLLLEIPEQKVNYSNEPQRLEASESDQKPGFQAVVLENNSVSAFSSMTKRQVIDFCKREYLDIDSLNQDSTLSVADCVLNNYQEVYQEINPDHNREVGFSNSSFKTNPANQFVAIKTQKKNKQAQSTYKGIREVVLEKCTASIKRQKLLSAYEKQLLIETCVADSL